MKDETRMIRLGGRDVFYDLLKGYAIFLVVWGHCIQAILADWQSNPVLLFIYMFHMPLFIAISGHFFLPSVKKYSTFVFLKKKFISLYLPSLSWGFLSCIALLAHKLYKHLPIDIGYFINVFFTGMWFLTVLFIVSVIGYFIYKFFRPCLRLPMSIVILVCFYLLPSNIWMAKEISFLAPFFFLSLVCAKCDWKKIPVWLALLATCLFLICFHFYSFDASMYKANNNYDLHTFCYFFLRFISGLCGIIFSSFLISHADIKINSGESILQKIGTKTLPIYVLHQKILLFPKLFPANLMSTIILSAIIIWLSLLMYRLLSWKYFRLFLFGQTNSFVVNEK